jgi:DNA-binding GntR family transcriptional regulator
MPPSHDPRPRLQPSLPKYLQIADHFSQQIENGTLAPGAELDSERVIGETFGVSRPTATRAIAELRQRGLVASRPGLGTFVRDDIAATDQDTDVSDLAVRITHLEHRLTAIPGDLLIQVEQIQRALGILQAQMIELRDHVGLAWKDIGTEPRTARDAT